MEIGATMAGSNKFGTILRAIGVVSGCSALAWAAGCDSKTSAGAPASGGPAAMPVQVEVVQAVRIPETTEYLHAEIAAGGSDQSASGRTNHGNFREVRRLRKQGHAAAAN